MGRVVIAVPPPFRKFVDGRRMVSVEAGTVREALEVFVSNSDRLRSHIFDEEQRLRRFVRVFVDGRQSEVSYGQKEALSDGAEMTILLAMAGG